MGRKGMIEEKRKERMGRREKNRGGRGILGRRKRRIGEEERKSIV